VARLRPLMVAWLTAALITPTPAQGACSQACVKRVKAKALKRQRAAEMRRYRRHPMPRCTWHGESGAGNGEWSMARYRARNPSSTAGGKFQIIDSTWFAFGGKPYRARHPAAEAPKVEQERIARRVLRGQGLGAWVLC
jgi:hypothetical protein